MTENDINLLNMRKAEFIKLIESIGFKEVYGMYVYTYNGYKLYVQATVYTLAGNSLYITKSFNNLEVIHNYFKKEFRTIKLKNILK